MKKNKRKYKDGDRVMIDGFEYVVRSYHYPSMTYTLVRSDGLNIFVKEDVIKERFERSVGYGRN